MKLTNPWVGYTDRSYRQIKEQLLNKLVTNTPEMKDLSESNILVIIVSMMAALVELLMYYIDMRAREGFPQTAEKFSSMVLHAKAWDYNIKPATPAMVDLYITFTDVAGSPVELTAPYVIPKGAVIATSTGIKFSLNEDVQANTGDTFAIVPASQNSEELLATTEIASAIGNWEVAMPTGMTQYSYRTMRVVDVTAGIEWQEVDTFAYSLPTDKHYKVVVNEDQNIVVVFGDGIRGELTPNAHSFTFSFQLTMGATGNTIAPNTITEAVLTVPIQITSPTGFFSVTNPETPSAGADIEGIESIRKHLPLHVRTLSRGVTLKDYEDLTLLIPGVGKAMTEYECGKEIFIYVLPSGGGVPTNALLSLVQNTLESKKMVGTRIIAKKAGITRLIISLNVNLKYRATSSGVSDNIKAALVGKFNFDDQPLNNQIHIADIYSTVDNVEGVDNLDIISIKQKPYPFAVSRDYELDCEIETTGTNTQTTNWKILYNGTLFRVFRNGLFMQNISTLGVGVTISNSILIAINSGYYEAGDQWNFTTYPDNTTLQLLNKTVGIIETERISLTLNSKLVG